MPKYTVKRKSLKKRPVQSTSSAKASSSSIDSAYKKEIVCVFLETLHMIKLFHWRTTSYAIHKATCELHSKLSENVDTFVEVMLGKKGDRVDLSGSKTMDLFDCTTSEELKSRLDHFKMELIKMSTKIDVTTNTDLLNIRDEMVGHLNQFMYLLTLC